MGEVSLEKIIELMGIESGVEIKDFEEVVELNPHFREVIEGSASRLRTNIASKSLAEAKKEMDELIRIGKMGRLEDNNLD